MTRLTRIPEVRVWAFLVVLTVGSLWIGIEHGLGTARVALAAILAIALVKVWFVGRYFMELRHAPAGLRRVVDAWLAITAAIVLGMYLAL